MNSTLFPELIEEFAAPSEKIRPWRANRYRLLSWWDMERFSAAAFQQVVMGLVFLTGKIEERLPPDIEAGDLAVKYIPIVESIRSECEKIGLTTSIVCANDFIGLADGMTAKGLTTALKDLENTIRREMQGCMFFHMPPERVGYYNQRQPFGASVAVKLPSLEYDITEAGTCYSMGRGTAWVFHLMRVMEVGVQRFGDRLGVPLVEEKNWQVILDQVNKAIKALPQKDAEAIAMGQVAAHLYNVKLAWRNLLQPPCARSGISVCVEGDRVQDSESPSRRLHWNVQNWAGWERSSSDL